MLTEDAARLAERMAGYSLYLAATSRPSLSAKERADLRKAAASLAALRDAYLAEGFTREEALALLAVTVGGVAQ